MKSSAELEAFSEIVRKVFPEQMNSPKDWEERYPVRRLSNGAMVTRVGPSPTGFMHIGTLYVGLLSERFAHQTSGVFYLRIEDTDKKREVEGATDFICSSFEQFRIPFDEGRDLSGLERGIYGPYTQSARKHIYHAYIRHLLEQGLAYFCFCTLEELDQIRQKQQAQGKRTGYYGEWALWRDKPLQDVAEMLSRGQPCVIRFKATGNYERQLAVDDLILGQRTLPENDQDVVIMKSDGLPTYHLAHVVDDHLMRTTHVIRGDEWLSSLPIHVQLFEAFGWPLPAYAHVAPINKTDGTSKRKLSKRKDPEANVGYFEENGYLPDALIEYLLNLANSNFEDWRKAHQQHHYSDFTVTFQKLQNSNGPLFDFKKLEDINREMIARLPAEDLYEKAVAWAGKFDAAFAALLTEHRDYAVRALSIERDGPKVRKDIGKLADVKYEICYFFDEQFHLTLAEITEKLGSVSLDLARGIVKEFMETYRPEDSKDEWFEKIKHLAKNQGFASNNAEFKKSPAMFKGSIVDAVRVFRILLTGRAQTPDLHATMQVMGHQRVFKRLSALQD